MGVGQGVYTRDGCHEYTAYDILTLVLSLLRVLCVFVLVV